MSGRILVLGPQRPNPNLASALADAGCTHGPTAVITAGWRYEESDIEPLRRELDRPTTLLPLYKWFDELDYRSPELKEAFRARQKRIQDYMALYRTRMSAAYYAILKLHGRTVIDEELHQIALFDSVRHLSELDDRAVRMTDWIRAEGAAELIEPWTHPAIKARHEEIRTVLSECESVCIAGGHVAILLNRMVFFGLGPLLAEFLERGGTIACWSAGAMALSERVVLFYDDPPEGANEPEILDRGLGLLRDHTLFPNARRRLRVADEDRLRLLGVRFGTCLGLENGAHLSVSDSGWEDRSAPDTLLRLTDGISANLDMPVNHRLVERDQ